jgi:hypothetical protein
MSTTPFVTQLRSRGTPIQLATGLTGSAITIRVEMPEVWDTVKVVVSSSQSSAEVKRAALAALYPGATHPDEYVLKLRGWEVLDENMPLAELGVIDGSILLLTGRRRRPVR